MPSFTKFRTALNARAKDASIVEPAILSAPDNGSETVVFSTTLDAVVAQALKDVASDKATMAEKQATKASQLARGLTLAILAVAAGNAPDIRAANGWRTLLDCETSADLAKAVQALSNSLKDAMRALDAERGTAMATTPRGVDAYRRGTGGSLGKGALKAPCALQATLRMLEDSYGASAAALDRPAEQAQKVSETLKNLPTNKARKAKAA